MVFRREKAKEKRRDDSRAHEEREFDQHIVDLRRVTRVTKGGKQLSFRATVVVGDRNGRVGYGCEKGRDVQIAVEKAARHAKKNLISVPINADKGIPHEVHAKFGASKVIIMPAPKGTGLKCGGALRVVLDFAGVENASSKIIDSTNKLNVIRATFNALNLLKPKR